MTIIKSQKMLNACLSHAKGVYQRGVLEGRNNLSGSDLQGKAKSYIGRYRQSSQNLIARCQSAGLKIQEIISDHNRRDLVIG
jgi:hypothetical protein